MLATPGASAFNDPQWLFQPKLDGIRALAYQNRTLRLENQRARELTAEYPGVVASLQKLPGRFVLDGEIVALDESGRPSLPRLQSHPGNLHYYVYDLLWLDGRDWTRSALEKRLAELARFLGEREQIRLVPSFPEHGTEVLESCLLLGFGGVVAKKLGSCYESGRRSKNWVEIQPTSSEEAVRVGASPEVELVRPEGPLPLLQQLQTGENTAVLSVEGTTLQVSALRQHLWPQYRKRDLLLYFARMAPLLLPHLLNRPLMLVRFPRGVAQAKSRSKSISDLNVAVPEFVVTSPVYSETKGSRPYLMCNNLPTLLWLAEIYALELHVWLSRVTRHPDALHLPEHLAEERGVLNYPDALLFDIDPYIYSGSEAPEEEPEFNPKAWQGAVRVARQLKALLDDLQFPALLKTSGKTGLHVLVPITRHLDFHATRALCRAICERLARDNSQITLAWSIEERRDKIFLDANQNTYGKTMASVYSPRAVPGAWVSIPLAWDQLEDTVPTDFNIRTVPDRFQTDPWQDFLLRKHELVDAFTRVG